ncbi:hypothetical protein SAMN04488124_2222 [Halogeometricum limi]|uniref:Uncharacterized protein n=1 Tax=Halogeometricum limi TaxID=555875 RepID=A0A1I6HGJ2_9EURY|nr:hypothetical protein SAMN04488124_2222 [Halogeometricum limi]
MTASLARIQRLERPWIEDWRVLVTEPWNVEVAKNPRRMPTRRQVIHGDRGVPILTTNICVDDSKTWNALISQVIRIQRILVVVPTGERPPVHVKIRFTLDVGQSCSLPGPIPAKQLEIIDCLSQVREHVGVVVPSDSNEGNTSLCKSGRHGLNGTERFRIPVLLVNQVTRNDDRINPLSNSRLREISPDCTGRKIGRIESVREPAWTTPDMNISYTKNLY